MESETKTCQNCKQQFTIEPEDFSFYEKIKVPPPTFCPECRLVRRLSFRNERSLYKRPCDLCKKDIITMYAKGSPYTVYCPTCYHSDGWDPMRYGREYDFSKPFFEQWHALDRAVPHLALLTGNSVDSPWINYELNDKNCYLNVGGHFNENCAYNQYALKCQETFDTYSVGNSQFVYETTLAEHGYKLFYSRWCFGCRDTYFSFDCRDCSNIFGCTGLRHKQYHIFNKPVSKEEFETFMRNNPMGSHANIKKLGEQVKEFWRSQPQRASFIEKSVNCTGNFIDQSKRCIECVNAGKTEDAKYIFASLSLKDAYDTSSVWWGERCYEFLAGGTGEQQSNIRFSANILRGSSDIEYSLMMLNAHHCFGSSNVRNKSYCILNKEYSKEEYETLRAKIIEQMNAMPYVSEVRSKNQEVRKIEYKYGEFFPFELSPFSYNETVAYEYFPLTKEEATSRGLSWHEPDSASHVPFSDYTIPDDIKDVKDDALEQVLKCEVSGKPFRLIPMELQFYRRFGLPIPRVSPFERHRAHLAFIRDHRMLRARTCGKCGKETMSVYSQKEFPTIYCNECYAREVT